MMLFASPSITVISWALLILPALRQWISPSGKVFVVGGNNGRAYNPASSSLQSPRKGVWQGDHLDFLDLEQYQQQAAALNLTSGCSVSIHQHSKK